MELQVEYERTGAGASGIGSRVIRRLGSVSRTGIIIFASPETLKRNERLVIRCVLPNSYRLISLAHVAKRSRSAFRVNFLYLDDYDREQIEECLGG